MENDINAGAARPETERSDAERAAADRPKEYFSVRLTLSGAAQEFEDPRQAGEAFFRADPAERPSVAHIDGNTARTMARTEIHGTHETGETRYFKSLPDSHAPDAKFRAGFLNAMEASLTERLGKLEWGKDGPAVTERLDTGLRDDLEAFARREPEKAATLWADHSDAVPPGPTLRAAVQAREATADRDVAAYRDTSAEKPAIIAAGDWVTTDANVELRPVAVASDRGIHTGYEANLPGGESELTYSERTFPSSREALRHAYDFYEGGEEGLELTVKRAAEMDRELVEEPDRRPEGLVLEHRPQPEFARPETAIYAGDDAQLVLTLGRDTENTRDLAERLVADPEFRKVVAEHIANAEATIGTGRFVDGEGSSGFLPDELLAVTSYGRDGGAEVLAKFPDEGPLSEALAKHLTHSPVMAAYVEEERQRSDFASDPARAISLWVAQSTAQIDRLPADQQGDLRSELQGIAKEAAEAFGLDRGPTERENPPRSTLYSTSISATALVVGGDETAFQNGGANILWADLSLNARLAGIDSEKLQKRLETGATNAHEEESWVKSDIADVAKRHGFDLGSAQGRNAAAEKVDRFYERAAELIQSARSIEVPRGPDPLVEALGSLAKVQASQGSVAFRNENQARDFAEEMKERYGATVLKDIASGRTEALAKDVPDPTARAAMAVAVVSAAKEHPSLGISAHEAEAAERRMVAQAASRPPEHARAHAHDRNQDREF
ncbi:hypothetical protein D2N39_21720 [Gemmobacter lutimaris]|uniref:Large polyvalent protein-associated domain-containing protein n=1 Tax=Gemmobacter lutimaris TaxID=2306023 RepID=A0A398BL70_9RHOB|nr:hypothetical protein [Gemmobacter lutimaris]RID89721.1 hypothetical protein D2N39_21720 [Gemmobacter lutimaris]